MFLINKKYIYIKFISLIILITYYFSPFWITSLYLLGGLYSILKEVFFFDKFLPFQIFVIIITLIISFFIYKIKVKNHFQSLLQDFVLMIFLIPMFYMVLDLLKIGADNDKGNLPYYLMFSLTFIVICLKEIKSKKRT